MKSTTRIALAGAVAFGFSAGAAMADGGLLVAIYKSGTQQYFLDQAQGFQDAAAELGFEARVINVELDANLAISAVADAIAAGAQGIAITVPDQAIGPAIAKAAAEAGIPLVATDDAISDENGNPVPFVGFNGTDMGTSVGREAGRLLQESGWLDSGDYGMLATQVQTLSVCMDRTLAASEQLVAAGADADKIIEVPYDGTTDSALTAAGPIITANQGINHWVVYACNDEGVLGTTNALRNAGYDPGDVIAVGLGAYEACRPWAQDIPTAFRAALYISGDSVGDAAAHALAANITDGTPLPAETIAPTTMVNPDNWQDSMSCE